MHVLLSLMVATSTVQSPPPPSQDAVEAPVLPVALASLGMSAIVLAVGTQAWWENGLQPFSIRETGLFGRDTYAGGADKLGHMYSSYVTVHIAASIYEALGLSPEASGWFAASFTFLLFNGFEIIDGFTEFGFEYGDVIFNTFGIAGGLLMRLMPEVERSFGFRLGYAPSQDFLDNPKSMLKFINDYSGMLYYFDVKALGVLEHFDVEPGFARHLIGGLVFGTQGYSPVRRAPEEKRRLLGIHLGLSVAELLRTNGDGDEGVELVARFFDFYAMPFFSVSLLKDLNGPDWILSFGLGHRAQVAL